jgi:hypothetical protein
LFRIFLIRNDVPFITPLGGLIMLPEKVKSLLKSRRFWVATVGFASVIASELVGVELDQEQIIGIVTVVVAWVIGDSVRITQ